MPTLITVSTMTNTSMLSLVIALGAITLVTGCSVIMPTARTEALPSSALEPTLIPEKREAGKGPHPSKEEVKKSDAETALDIAGAEPERPYMAPPVIPGVDPAKPIFPTPDEAPEISSDITPKAPSKPEKPKVLSAPKSMIRGEDGLYYATGFEKPFSGLSRVRFPNGDLYGGDFKGGKPDGKGMQWDKDGNKKFDGIWHAGQFFTGRVYFYYAGTDKIKLKGEYLEGRLVGGHGFDRTGQSY